MKKQIKNFKNIFYICIGFILLLIMLIFYCDHYAKNVFPNDYVTIERRSHVYIPSIEIADSHTSLSTPASDTPQIAANPKAITQELVSANVSATNEYILETESITETSISTEVATGNPSEESISSEAVETINTSEEELINVSFRVKNDVNILNLRCEPDSNSSIVAKLTSISRGKVLNYDENWAHVKTTNYEGYVATQFIIITE